jgi:hypothetical protein
MQRTRIILVVVSVGLLSLGLLACSVLQPPTPTPMPTATPTATLPPTPTPTPTQGLVLPADAVELLEVAADLTGDGAEQHIAAYRAGDVEGLAINAWWFELPTEHAYSDLQVRSLALGTPPKVLLYAKGDDSVSKYLYLFNWNGEEGVLSPPQDGELEGMDAFRSAHYWPVTEDGDFDGAQEISVLIEADHPDFLEILYYEYDYEGDAYRRSTRFMALPKAVPSEPID